MNIALAGTDYIRYLFASIMEMTMQDVKGGQLRTENQKLTTGFRNRELLSKPVVSFELSVLS
jgi:hypothetical protein